MLGGQYLSHEHLSNKLKRNFEIGILETIAETYLESMGLKTVNVQIIPSRGFKKRDIIRGKKHG